ncbi:MAG: two-component regulator propeller domain-containing protein [Bacteroidia bacterium]|nr:two-component regulator propeller domain-containing protein [Bacteroidia bacterium]
MKLLPLGLIFTLLAGGLTAQPGTTFSFSHLSLTEGLSSPMTFCALEDTHGFMWFGTSNGLNLYDGTQIKVYQHDPADTTSLGHSIVKCLYQDKAGRIWIGTQGGGLDCYVPESGQFIHYTHRADDTTTLIHNEVLSITEDHQGRLWVGTEKGLCFLDKDRKSFRRIYATPGQECGLQAPAVISLYLDRQGILWAATWDGGLHYLIEDAASQTFCIKSIQAEPDRPDGLTGNRIWGITEDMDGRLWIGVFGKGVSILSPARTRATGRYSFIQGPPPQQLEEENIFCLARDPQHRIWIGTGNGLIITPPIPPGTHDTTLAALVSRPWTHLQKSPIKHLAPISSEVRHIIPSSQGMMWLATREGVSSYHASTTLFNSFLHETAGVQVHAILRDAREWVWMGTPAGVVAYHPPSQRLRQIPLPDDRVASALHLDKTGQLWIGTDRHIWRMDTSTLRLRLVPLSGLRFVSSIIADPVQGLWVTSHSGLYQLGPQGEQIRRYHSDNSNILDNQLNQAVFHESGSLWIASDNAGLIRATASKGGQLTFSHFYLNDEGPISLFNKNYRSLTCDDTSVWVGSVQGVYQFHLARGRFTNIYNSHQGLVTNNASSIIRGTDGTIWIQSDPGVARLDQAQRQFVYYTYKHGLGNEHFYLRSSYCASDGTLVFGGERGFSLLPPGSIVPNRQRPVAMITGLRIAGRPVKPGEVDSSLNRPILNKSLIYQPELTLSHKHLVFTLEFSVISPILSSYNHARYRLTPLESDWNEVSAQRFATYTNLDPGTYTFELMGANYDGVWSDPISLKITILPPYWETWWFKLCVFLLMLGGTGYYFYWRDMASQAREAELSRLVEQRTEELVHMQEKEQEARMAAEQASKAKSQFLSVMSHEIRTPLHAVIGMTHFLQNESPRPDQVDHLSTLYFSATNLLSLINDILDYSKIEAGKLELEQVPFDCRKLVQELAQVIGLRCQEKGLEMLSSFPADLPAHYIGDPTRLAQVLMNLLGNAVKFTESGSVSLVVTALPTGGLRFEVSDSGIGIEPSRQQAIFEEFIQASADTSRRYGGTGLGLAISRRILHLMQSDIHISSQPGTGSVFYFDLNLPPAPDHTQTAPPKPQENCLLGLRILVAEDNPVNQKIVLKFLDKWGVYSQLVANGELAVQAMGQATFDLILMDLQMPVMDGVTATRLIRAAGHTLPIIGLSASILPDDVRLMKEAGMNACVPKPFKPDMLREVILQQTPTQPEVSVLAMSDSEESRDMI